MKAFAERTPLNRVEKGAGGPAFITSGIAYLYVKESFPDASVLKLGFSYPFCDDKIREFAASADELFVVEELDPFLEEHLQQIGVKATAKHSSFRIGELRPEPAERPPMPAGSAPVSHARNGCERSDCSTAEATRPIYNKPRSAPLSLTRSAPKGALSRGPRPARGACIVA